MQRFAYVLATTLTLAMAAAAGPLPRAEVAADAKWVLHLDVDQLRATPAGASLVKEIVDKALEGPRTMLKREAGVDLNLSRLNSVTVYGDYSGSNNGNSVVLLRSDLEVEKVLDAALEQTRKGLAAWPFEKSLRDGVIIYTLPDHSSVWVRPDKITLFSKSSKAIAKANEVLAGRAASLASSRALADFPDLPKRCFFFGAAEGFNADPHLNAESTSEGKSNPKATLLRLADSGRILIGQEGDQVFLNVSLKAKTAGAVKQMQQVVQGMIALASLTHSENQDFQQAADSAKVSAAADIVTLSLSFPADKALLLLNQQLERHLSRPQLEGGTNAPPKTNQR